MYGEATTQLLEFDEKGNFVRQLGKGVYGLAYAHSVRFDKYDNLWVVDKAIMSVMKFNPEGMVVMNLGRRDEGPDEPRYRHANPPPVPVDAMFNGTTDVTWDADDNIYISDGYFNSEIAKFDKHGNWIKRWGSAGKGGEHANENPGQFSNPHNIGIDRQGNIYAADRGNRRIQVFDTDGNFKRFIFLNAPYDKSRHPVLGNPIRPTPLTKPRRGPFASRKEPRSTFTPPMRSRAESTSLRCRAAKSSAHSGNPDMNSANSTGCMDWRARMRISVCGRHEQLAGAEDHHASGQAEGSSHLAAEQAKGTCRRALTAFF